MKKILLITAILTSITGFTQILDTSFDSNGIVTDQFSTTPIDDSAFNAVLQPDGKIIYVGRTTASGYKAIVCRLNTDGTKDTTFNNYGFKYFNPYGFEAVKLQTDGKIIVAGMNNVYRLNTDGSIDATGFGNNVNFQQTINGFLFYIHDLAIQTDGKIVLAGNVSTGSYNDFGLIRLNTDGTLDTTFGNAGKQTISFGSLSEEAFGIIIQPDGKIVVAGQTYNGTNYDFALARLTTAGVLDSTFGTNGKTTTQLNGIDYGRTIDLQADGKILMIGTTEGKAAIVRYTANGILDTSFNTTGYYISAYSSTVSNSVTNPQIIKPRIKYLTSGKILTSGTFSNTNYGLLQFNSNGTLDTTFQTNGAFSANSNNYSTFLLIKSDSKILTGGTSSLGSSSYKITTFQFSSTGVNEGYTDFNLVTSDDKILQTVEATNGKTISMLSKGSLVRYNTDGNIDTTFGNLGVVNNINGSPNRLKKQPDGKLLLDSTGAIALFKYNQDGTPVTTFGTNGVVYLYPNTGSRCSFIDNFYPMNNGKILVLFDYDESIDNAANTYGSFGILILNNDGSIDQTFGTNGLVKLRFNTLSNTSNEYPTNAFIQSDGKIIIQGFLYTVNVSPSNYIMGITRLNTNGTVDTTFGNNGYITYSGTGVYGRQLLGQANDKFLINYTNNGLTHTIKYNANGSIDTSFGTNGIVSDNFYSNDMIQQNDGKILKGGHLNSQYNIMRYNTNGTIDTTFGTNGNLSTSINFSSYINTLLLLQNGKLLAGGGSFDGSRNLATQALYTNLTLGTLDFTDNISSAMIYPNPIQQEATFDFDLKNNENISVEIVDIQGKTVQTLVKNKELQAGNHKQNIDVSNLSSGNYILKFSSASGSQAIKIVKQ